MNVYQIMPVVNRSALMKMEDISVNAKADIG